MEKAAWTDELEEDMSEEDEDAVAHSPYHTTGRNKVALS
jgi:hypothetical protein